jgi:hypothetical protein
VPDSPTRTSDANAKMNELDDELLPHYDFDYSKAKPNRFAKRYNKTVRRVGLEPDVAEQFPTEESVNEGLRDYIRITKGNDRQLSSQ